MSTPRVPRPRLPLHTVGPAADTSLSGAGPSKSSRPSPGPDALVAGATKDSLKGSVGRGTAVARTRGRPAHAPTENSETVVCGFSPPLRPLRPRLVPKLRTSKERTSEPPPRPGLDHSRAVLGGHWIPVGTEPFPPALQDQDPCHSDSSFVPSVVPQVTPRPRLDKPCQKS